MLSSCAKEEALSTQKKFVLRLRTPCKLVWSSFCLFENKN